MSNHYVKYSIECATENAERAETRMFCALLLGKKEEARAWFNQMVRAEAELHALQNNNN